MTELQRKLSDWPLSWITREQLKKIVSKLIVEATPKTKDLSYKNVVDPFSALFDMAVTGLTYESWIEAEIRRQHQKTLQNAIGKFHQSVLGSVDGWEDKGVGEQFDLLCPSRKIFAEVKNKFNTVKASDKSNLYDNMTRWRGIDSEHKQYTGYYVQILTKAKFDRPFVPSDNKTGNKVAVNPHIREIDGVSFYTLVTGSSTALQDLYGIFPYVLESVCHEFDAEKAVNHEKFLNFYNLAFNP